MTQNGCKVSDFLSSTQEKHTLFYFFYAYSEKKWGNIWNIYIYIYLCFRKEGWAVLFGIFSCVTCQLKILFHFT